MSVEIGVHGKAVKLHLDINTDTLSKCKVDVDDSTQGHSMVCTCCKGLNQWN